jgi:hypothetical protein
MKNSSFISGAVLLSIGVILLLTNLGVMDFNWLNAISFWPLIIVFYGVSLLLPQNTTGRVLSALFALASLAFVVYVGVDEDAANRIYKDRDRASISNRLKEKLAKKFERIDSIEELALNGASTTTFPAGNMKASEREALLAQINYLEADLQFESQTVNLTTESGRDLFSAKTDPSHKKFLKSTYASKDSIVHLVFKEQGGSEIDEPSTKPVEVSINPEKTYDLILRGSNGEANLELTNASLRSLKLDWDDGDCMANLPHPKGEISIRSYGSDTDLQLLIPVGVAFRVEATNPKELNINGITQLENDVYQTTDFEVAKDRYLIRAESPKRLVVKQN